MTKNAVILVLLLAFTSEVVVAGEHALGAHEHGAIKIGLAIDKNIVEIDIDGPAESFLGFEYLPKTAKEKKLLSDLKIQWTKKIETYFAFDKKLNCVTNTASFEQVIDEKETAEAQAKLKTGDKKESGVHSDIEAKAKLTCAQNLSGTNLTISLRKSFKNIKKLSAEILSNETKSVEIVKDIQVVQL